MPGNIDYDDPDITRQTAKEIRAQRVSNFVALGLNYTQNELYAAADVVKQALGLKK